VPDVLVRPRDEVRGILDRLIARGQEEVEKAEGVKGPVDAQAWLNYLEGWHDLVEAGLRASYEGVELVDEFGAAAVVFVDYHDPSYESLNRAKDATKAGVAKLWSIRDRLDFAEDRIHPRVPLEQEPAAQVQELDPPRSVAEAASFDRKIFLVHGHDEAAKATVARFLDQVTEAGVTILHEQADRGQTIIEKFEEHAGDAGYAVVLLTGDDAAAKSGATEGMLPRARQNVILELGFFIGRLGRERVAILYEQGVELPSDIAGVLFLPLDPEGAWKTKLAREMRAAQVPVDLEKLLSS
jgi:predicted nucleotide-binding protein